MGYFSRRVSLEKHEFSFGWYKLRWTVCSQVQFWMIQITMDSVFTGSVSDDTNYNSCVQFWTIQITNYNRQITTDSVFTHIVQRTDGAPQSSHKTAKH